MTDNKQTALQFMNALGRGDGSALGELLSEDVAAICTGTCILSGTRSYSEILGAAGMLKQATKGGIDFRILSTTAEDDRVSLEAQGSATLADGRRYNNEYHFLFFIRNGKICRIKEYMDTKLVEETFNPAVAAARVSA